jgi:hypothetical protein
MNGTITLLKEGGRVEGGTGELEELRRRDS